jgi:NTE family protein
MSTSEPTLDPTWESPALGTGLEALSKPCGDALRPADPPKPHVGPTIGVTLSGGGFRATFAALGVLRYLADTGLLESLRYASSVSGGSVANGMLATRWPQIRAGQYSTSALDAHVIGPLSDRVTNSSLKKKILANLWRAMGAKTRTDVLAWALDDWFFHNAALDCLDPECRWIFNAANLTTGVRFAFERDVVGDYVVGLAHTSGSGLEVARAVAASAAVPGSFAPIGVPGVRFPCGGVGSPRLLDGGAYDNTGLEALDGDRYSDVFTVSMNAGGVFVTGAYGRIRLVRELARANSLLYHQSTALRTRWMVDRFQAWEHTPAGQGHPRWGRQGVLVSLGTTIDAKYAPPEFQAFTSTYPEHRTFDGKDLALFPTVFDQLPRALVDRFIYRGWWLTGAALARWHPGFAPLKAGTEPPPLRS